MRVYYYLLNEIGIISLNNNTLTISNRNINKEYNNQIISILKTLTTTNDYKLEIVDQSAESLKNKLIDIVKESQLWQIINSKFKNVEISDIIHINNLQNK